MLVTLGSNTTIGAGASQTFQYACNSLQSIYLRCDDDGQDALNGFVTVQIGNDVICNDISFKGLSLVSLVTTGGKYNGGDAIIKLDFGSHILEPLENVYVTLRNGGSASMTANDVSAIVNEGGVYEPLKYTNYNDSVFTDSNTLAVYAWSASTLENDITAFTIRNQAYSATPQVQSGVNVALTQVPSSETNVVKIGVMAKNQVPSDTSVNYSSTIIEGVICISAMAKMPSKANASAQQGRAVLSSMTSSERKAL